MTVTYLYHSGFTVEFEDIMLVFDYYKGELPETAEGKKLYVFSSHYHKDHFQYQVFDWAKEHEAVYILSKDIRTKGPQGKTVKVKKHQEIQVDGLRVRTLRSTDEGVAFLVSVKGITIYHAGDLNWWHWKEESPEYNEKMKEDYQKEIGRIEGEHIDLAFVPLDPRLEEAYGWGIDYFMRHTDTERVFPMHLWGGYRTIERFLEDPLSEGYRDRIVRIERRQQRF
ncbi:MAG: MBL fold metallo-hydrolase [Dorea sp.]|nr:MBL fold metallo-hydrolase [Dorea sp.]